MVVLRDSRPESCVFGGEHVIDEGRAWRETDGGASEVNSCSMGSIRAALASSSADWESSGISEALGGRAGVLACCSWVQR